MFGIGNSYGINSMSWYSNLSRINDMKLNQVMAKRNMSSIGAVNSVKPSLGSDSAEYIKEYQKKMTDLLNKANTLREDNKAGVASNLVAASGDEDILTANAKYRISEPAEYTVNVLQTAKAQVNRSEGVDSTAAPALSGDLTIATSKGTYTFSADNISATDNRNFLSAMADKINSSKAGVTAKVVNENGKSSLEITGAKTGEGNGFVASGTFAEQAGLSTAAQEAQDAVYTVAKQGSYGPQEFTSSDNEVTIGSYQITATLKGEGSTTVSVGQDADRTASALEDLVGSFNSALKFLNNNADKGVGGLNQMRRMIIPPTSEKSMAMAGLTINKDGTLAFDKKTFMDSAAKRPDLVQDIVSGNHGVAQGVYSDARAGLNTSSASLLSNTAQENTKASSKLSRDYNSFYSPLNVLSTYNRNGVYNLSNYYSVGLLMNMSI